MSIILLALHAAQMANAPRARSEEQKLESKRPWRSRVKKVKREITILSRRGLDGRLAMALVHAVNRFDYDIRVTKNGTEVDGKSLLGMMMLGVKPGSKLRIRTTGPDAPETLRQIERLISSFAEGCDTIEAQYILDRPKLDAEVAKREGF